MPVLGAGGEDSSSPGKWLLPSPLLISRTELSYGLGLHVAAPSLSVGYKNGAGVVASWPGSPRGDRARTPMPAEGMMQGARRPRCAPKGGHSLWENLTSPKGHLPRLTPCCESFRVKTSEGDAPSSPTLTPGTARGL